MLQLPLIHIRWSGDESVDIACKLVLERHSVELDLPLNLHHALFAHLFPDASPADPEEVDISGDVALLKRAAEIGGFGNLGRLIEPVSQTGARIHIQSPPPRIIIEV
jgi:hypothetical protein